MGNTVTEDLKQSLGIRKSRKQDEGLWVHARSIRRLRLFVERLVVITRAEQRAAAVLREGVGGRRGLDVVRREVPVRV
jgi:hypothetical protein